MTQREKEIMDAISTMGYDRLDPETFPKREVDALVCKGLKSLKDLEAGNSNKVQIANYLEQVEGQIVGRIEYLYQQDPGIQEYSKNKIIGVISEFFEDEDEQALIEEVHKVQQPTTKVVGLCSKATQSG